MSIQKMCLQCSFHSLYLGINLNFECSPPPKLIWPPQKNGLLGGAKKCWGGAKNPKIFRASREILLHFMCWGASPPPRKNPVAAPALPPPYKGSKGNLLLREGNNYFLE